MKAKSISTKAILSNFKFLAQALRYLMRFRSIWNL